MYNSLYDDERHGLELAQWKREHAALLNRALGLCRSCGFPLRKAVLIRRTPEDLRMLIQEALNLLDERHKQESESWGPAERRKAYASLVHKQKKRTGKVITNAI